jgi:hypothetical protein
MIMRPPVAILSAIAATLLVTTLGQGQEPEAAVVPIVISDVKISDIYKQVAIRDEFGDPQTRTKIRPLPTRKLVVVEFKLKAQVADAKAMDKLKSHRKKAALVIPDAAQQKEAKRGDYRFFDMADLHLVDADGKKHPAVWPIDQLGLYIVQDAKQTFIGSVFNQGAATPWLASLRTQDGVQGAFTSLIKVGEETDVKFVFTIPRGAEVGELKLRHREDVPEPLPKEVKKVAVKPAPPPSAKDKETLAAELLKKAEAVAAASPTLARVRCEEILRLYPTTKAAAGARALLKKLENKRDGK